MSKLDYIKIDSPHALLCMDFAKLSMTNAF
jgi:hypothetical protein